ncbi:MAG: hypothetical protein BWY79_01812 [Actinobacteria bacterium ADurb.Bin444]|nr:MAG: hypothetical protein BWY79_01812 [Actinobacteria bacterium ADurb.Bin444]
MSLVDKLALCTLRTNWYTPSETPAVGRKVRLTCRDWPTAMEPICWSELSNTHEGAGSPEVVSTETSTSFMDARPAFLSVTVSVTDSSRATPVSR